MSLFNVGYDLHNEKNYDRVANGIKSTASNWARPLKSTWMVEYEGTASQLADALDRYFDRDDTLFVTEVRVRNNSIAWKRLSQQLIDWMQAVFNRLIRYAA